MNHDFYYDTDITQIDPSKTFENFYVGDSNRKAYETAKNAAEHCGTSINPLCIKIDSGYGGYHLLCAIINHMKSICPKYRIRVMSVREIVDDYLKNCKRDTSHVCPAGKQSGYHSEKNPFAYSRFEERFDHLDCLVLTDLELTLRGKDSTQGEILQIMEHILSESNLEKRKYNRVKHVCPQIILLYEKNYDLPMKGMEHFERQLEKKFAKIGNITVKAPELELKLSFIEAELKKHDLKMSATGKKLIAKCFSDFAGIESILHQCKFKSNMNHKNVVEKEMVEELLEHHF